MADLYEDRANAQPGGGVRIRLASTSRSRIAVRFVAPARHTAASISGDGKAEDRVPRRRAWILGRLLRVPARDGAGR